MKKVIHYLSFTCIVGIMLFQSCSEDDPVDPPKVEIFCSIVDKQVAFTALTKRVETLSWDFGDGETSFEENPVHTYADGGYYTVILSGTNSEGVTQSDTADLAVAVTPYVLLTGGPTAENGKTWKLSSSHSSKDRLVNADAELTLLDDDIQSLPAGAFSYYLGLPEAYNDEFTFNYDGSYEHNTSDGSSFAGIVYAYVMAQFGQTSIVKTGGEDVLGADAFALATYTPADDASFELVENEDFAVPTIPSYATGVTSLGIPTVTYSDVMTLDFPDSNEFIGLMDFQQKVIVEELTDKSMRLVMFVCLSSDAILSYSPLSALNTSAVVLTFEVVE